MPVSIRESLFFVLFVVGVATAVAALPNYADASDETLITILHPGWNLIGWIHDSESASSLFEKLPELRSIHAENGSVIERDRSVGRKHLNRLEPGQGYWFRIAAEGPLEWHRHGVVDTRLQSLQSGPQLIAWAGRSPIAVDDALANLSGQLNVAWRWDPRAQEFLGWAPRFGHRLQAQRPIWRGEAILLNLASEATWKQPLGDLPRFTFPGGFHDQLPEDFAEIVQSDARWVIEQFAARLHFAVDPDSVEFRITTTDQAKHQEFANYYGATPEGWGFNGFTVHGSPGERRHVIIMSTWPWGVWSSTSGWSRFDARLTIAHMYFYVLQHEWADGASGDVPGWLTIGSAEWFSEWLVGRTVLATDVQQLSSELDLRQHESASRRDFAVALAAVAILAEDAGRQPILEFWRNLPSRDGTARQWKIVFAETFGFTPGEFYDQFYQFRRPQFTIINGIVRTDDGEQPALWIRAWPDQGISRGRGEPTFGVEPDSAGAFTLILPRYVLRPDNVLSYVLSVALRARSQSESFLFLTGCAAPIANDHSPRPFAEHRLRLPQDPTALEADLELIVPSTFCQHRIRVRLAVEIADQLGDYSVSFCDSEGRCRFGDSFDDHYHTGRFIEPGAYSMRIRRECPSSTEQWQFLYVAERSLTSIEEQATRFVSSADAQVLRPNLRGPIPSCR